jgi:RNA polymerase sigma factor (sigma-70 family)
MNTIDNTKLTDNEKWERYKKGDDQVLSIIYNENARILYQYGLKFTLKRSIIEDVIQDLFSNLISNRKGIGTTDNIKFYLLKSFKRKLFRQLKKETRYKYSSDLDDYTFEVRYSIEHEIIIDEDLNYRAALLIKLLKRLSSHQREAIYLKFTLGLTYDEISEVMHMSIESGRNLIYRAIKSLRKSIEEKSGSDMDFQL